MKLHKTREALELEVKAMLDELVNTNGSEVIGGIIEHLNNKHNMNQSTLYEIMNNSNNISKLELAELALFGAQVTRHIGANTESFLSEWFTEREIKDFERFQQVDLSSADELEFPITFKNVTELGNGYYNLTLDMPTLALLRKYGKLNYNEKVQRGTRKVEKYGSFYYEPITFPKKIDAIKKSILKGEAFPSVIALNAAQMSAVDGLELEYNEKDKSITIHEGTILDIVDGMHRVLGNYAAWNENKDIKGAYIILLSNKSDEEVKLHQVDIDKSTKLLSGRIKELSNTSKMSEVINIIKTSAELKGRITSATDTKAKLGQGELFPYSILLDILEKNFKVTNTLEARKLANQINEYNVYLFGYFGACENNEYKALFDVYTYEGHLTLMKKMIEQDIDFENLNHIIKIEDFAPEGQYNKEVFTDSNKLTIKERNKIKEYFKELIN